MACTTLDDPDAPVWHEVHRDRHPEVCAESALAIQNPSQPLISELDPCVGIFLLFPYVRPCEVEFLTHLSFNYSEY